MGARRSSCANAVSHRPSVKNVSSQPYPVIASSGRQRIVTPSARACSIAVRRCQKFSSHANGVWLTHATPTLTSLIGSPVGDQMLGEQRRGAVDVQEVVL